MYGSLENNSSNSKEIKLIGDFKKEVNNGLLKSGTLNGRFIENNADTIIIEGNSNVRFIKIEFIGEYAGTSSMSNKKLPMIEVVEITKE